MDLSSLLKKRTGWASFEGKFDVELAYVDKEQIQKKIDACKKTVFIKHQPSSEIDVDKLLAFLAGVIISWRGLTFAVAATMLAIDVPPELAENEVPCDMTNKLELLKKAHGFDVFIQRASTDLSALHQEEAEKNSESGQGTT